MKLSMVEKVANALLYEGYMLYPYRPSAVKNQQRFNFGALYPESFSLAARGTDACTMRTECLVVGTEDATLDIKVRCLHLLAREVGRPATPLTEFREDVEPKLQFVAALEVGEQIFQTWQEAVEREINLSDLSLSELVAHPQPQAFTFPASRKLEPLRDESGQVVGVMVRTQQAIEGVVEAEAVRVDETLFKVAVRIKNATPFEDAKLKSRDEALLRAMASTHTILSVRDGLFVSLLEPPGHLREAAAACDNKGTWPVLVGEDGARNVMLSSPIILYDYPQIAPESAGDLFDGTEIDEILTLRIMTLTDEEKREMRGADERARQILERTEALPVEQLMKLHGALRGLRPAKEEE